MRVKNLLVWVSVAVMAGAVAFVAAHQRRTMKLLSHEFQEHQFARVKQLSRELEGFLWGHANGLKAISFSLGRHFEDQGLREAELEAHWERAEGSYLAALFVQNQTGKLIHSLDPGLAGSPRVDSDLMAWAAEAGDGDRAFLSRMPHELSHPTKLGRGEPSSLRLVLGVPVLGHGPGDAPEKRLLGVISLMVNVGEFLIDLLSAIDPRLKIHQIWIMEDDGTLIFQSEHPDMIGRNVFQTDASCNQCHVSFEHAIGMLGRRQGTVHYEMKGFPRKMAVFSSMEFENASWILVMNADEAEAMATAQRSLKASLTLLGILLLVGIGVSAGGYVLYRSRARKPDPGAPGEQPAPQDEVVPLDVDYRMVVESAPDFIWTADCQGRFTFVNERLVQWCGQDASDLMGKPFFSLVGRDTLNAVQECFREVRAKGESRSLDTRMLSKAGEALIVSLHLVPFCEDGRVIGMVAFGRDITERRQSEDARELECERLEAMTEHVGAGIAVISRNLVIRWANRMLKENFGEDLEQLPCYMALGSRSSPCAPCGAREVFRTGGGKSACQRAMTDKHGMSSRWWVIATAIRNGRGEVTAAVELFVPFPGADESGREAAVKEG
jgi:PAS domain S-box-containing protein